MARQIQIRRGTTLENDNFIGAIGEITMDTDAKTLRVHDGETVGGIALARTSDIMGDYVIETQLPTAENNYTWFRKYKSGWVEQGGHSTSQTIILPVEMADTNYNIQMTGQCDALPENNVYLHGFRNITTTGFTTQCNVLNCIGNSAETNLSLKHWYVFGIAKQISTLAE